MKYDEETTRVLGYLSNLFLSLGILSKGVETVRKSFEVVDISYHQLPAAISRQELIDLHYRDVDVGYFDKILTPILQEANDSAYIDWLFEQLALFAVNFSIDLLSIAIGFAARADRQQSVHLLQLVASHLQEVLKIWDDVGEE